MHPVLFQIGDFYVGTYGILIVLGLASALALTLYLSRPLKIPAENFYDLIFIVVLSGFIGARVLFIFLNFDQFLQTPLSILFAREGFVFFGGFVAAAIAALVFIKKKQMPLGDTADVIAPALAIGHGFGRIGCFAAGCCYGKVCSENFPLGIHLPHILDRNGKTIFSYAYSDHLYRGLITPEATTSAAVLPVQLFESTGNFLICGLLLLLWKRRQFPGQIFLIYLMLYSGMRFILEYFRGDIDRGVWLGGRLSTSQIIALVVMAVAAVAWKYARPHPLVTRGAPRAHI